MVTFQLHKGKNILLAIDGVTKWSSEIQGSGGVENVNHLI